MRTAAAGDCSGPAVAGDRAKMIALTLVLSLLVQITPPAVEESAPPAPVTPLEQASDPPSASGLLRTAGGGVLGALSASLGATLILAPVACLRDSYGIGPGCAYAGGLFGLLVGVPLGSAVGVWLAGGGSGYLLGSAVGALAGGAAAALLLLNSTNVVLVVSVIVPAPFVGPKGGGLQVQLTF